MKNESIQVDYDPPPCEACGEPGPHRGCTLLPRRVICRRCLSVWYDTGITGVAELGEESRRWRDDPNHWIHNNVLPPFNSADC